LIRNSPDQRAAQAAVPRPHPPRPHRRCLVRLLDLQEWQQCGLPYTCSHPDRSRRATLRFPVALSRRLFVHRRHPRARPAGPSVSQEFLRRWWMRGSSRDKILCRRGQRGGISAVCKPPTAA